MAQVESVERAAREALMAQTTEHQDYSRQENGTTSTIGSSGAGSSTKTSITKKRATGNSIPRI